MTRSIREIAETLSSRMDPANRQYPEWRGMGDYLQHVEKVVCADGFTMSVQASASHYCSPRDSKGPWDQVEIGFPSERVEAFMPYVENAEDPTGTVYGWVPIELVIAAIAYHGGFAVNLPAVQP